MLANDVPPNRLQRVKLATQDLIRELRGDRIGLIAFAGRAFLQAPLTIDYDAAAESLNDFDTNIIPEGGTNISDAITLAVKTFGKSAVGNRALIIFTDGEELAGESVKVAKMAADSGVRIFTVGVGTPEGSLIPLQGAGGGSSFVKDSSGQVVKSKLDENRLREIAESTGGLYVRLTSGPAAMRQLYSDGLAKMQAAEIDARASRQPIERYQWPLAGAVLALSASLLMNERKARRRVRVPARAETKALAAAAATVILFFANLSLGAAPGLEEYKNEQFADAYKRFQETLQEHPETHASDKIQFDAGAAAYKMKNYNKALESFSQALLSKDLQLQSQSHYNLGNTLYQRGDAQKKNEEKLKDWSNALQHYEQTLKLQPENKEAKENSEYVKNKIEELKKQQEQQPSPTPSPSPSPSPKDQKKQDKNDKSKNNDKNEDQQQQQQQDQDQKDNQDKKQGKDDQQKPGQSPSPSPQPGQTPSPSPGSGSSPSPSPGEQQQPSPSPGENGASPSPSPGENGESASPSPSPGEGQNATPSPTASATPEKKQGDVKSAGEDQPQQPNEQPEEAAEAEEQQGDQMNEQQAERLLRAMRDEEARVQLDERKAVRRVLKDW
jgi:Ca-activated chloride channel family protein